jgi:hypothetical protein
MICIGVDPGLSGAIAAIDSTGEVVGVHAMPTMPSPIPKRRMVDGRELAAVIRGFAHAGRSVVAVELVGAMPGNGGVTMFSFGQSFGTILGVLGALGTPYQFVRPQVWKKHHGLGADKAQSIGAAMRRWPELNLLKKDDGIAEALLIADWLRMNHGIHP